MRSFYCNKFMRGLAGFGGDGFCLCEENKVGDGAALNVLLCSSAFLLALGLSPDAALKADLLALLDALEPAGPQTAVSLAPAVVAAAGAERAATATPASPPPPGRRRRRRRRRPHRRRRRRRRQSRPRPRRRRRLPRARRAAARVRGDVDEQPLRHAFGARADGEHVALLPSAAPDRYRGGLLGRMLDPGRSRRRRRRRRRHRPTSAPGGRSGRPTATTWATFSGTRCPARGRGSTRSCSCPSSSSCSTKW